MPKRDEITRLGLTGNEEQRGQRKSKKATG
jgi:hypothetical protein